jgi:hypothetical protein
LAYSGTSLNPVTTKKFDATNFMKGFSAFGFEFRQDVLIASFLLPLIVGLFILSKKGNIHADSVMMVMTIMLISAPVLVGTSDHQNTPYRFVPLVVFFAIGAGLFFSKKPIVQS